uniref:Tudor-knot domain-containing protein n=1 Tax=Panagrolaimus sp. PS1159 TaxID=55785 RepID=A0AC35F7D5_9BILA
MSLWGVDPIKPTLFHLPPPPEPPSIHTLQNRTKQKSKQAKLLNGLPKPTASKSLSIITRPKNAMNLSTILHPKPTICVSTIAHPTQTSIRSLLAVDSFKPTKSVSAIKSLPKPKKATILHVNKEYSPDYEYFRGHLVVLKPSARERSRNCEGKQTVYYVHYARLNRRMDEWIDVHEIHSAVDSSTIPTFSQCGSSLILSDFNDPPAKNTRSQKKMKMMKISKI